MADDTRTPLLSLKQLTKKLGAIAVMDRVDLDLYPGEVVTIFGQAGAGHDVVAKTIAGYDQPTDGKMEWEGQPLEFSRQEGPDEAQKLGIEVIYQSLGLIGGLSIERNFFLGREKTRSFLGITFLNHRSMAKVVQDQLNSLGVTDKFKPNDPFDGLPPAYRQTLIIQRARYFGAKLIILADPVADPKVQDTQMILKHIKQAREEGITVLIIANEPNAMKDASDRVVVLEEGQKQGEFKPSDLDDGKLRHHMGLKEEASPAPVS